MRYRSIRDLTLGPVREQVRWGALASTRRRTCGPAAASRTSFALLREAAATASANSGVPSPTVSKLQSSLRQMILVQALIVIGQNFDHAAIGDAATGTLRHHPLEFLFERLQPRDAAFDLN